MVNPFSCFFARFSLAPLIIASVSGIRAALFDTLGVKHSQEPAGIAPENGGFDFTGQP